MKFLKMFNFESEGPTTFLSDFSFMVVTECQELDDKICDLPTTKYSILLLMNSKVIYFNKYIKKQYISL